MQRVEETEHLSWFNFRLKISFSASLLDPDPAKMYPYVPDDQESYKC